MNNDNKKIEQQLSELTDVAKRLSSEAIDENVCSTDSYEKYRDVQRFMIGVIVVCSIASYILLVVSLAAYFTKDPGDTFTTSRSGEVDIVRPFKVD